MYRAGGHVYNIPDIDFLHACMLSAPCVPPAHMRHLHNKLVVNRKPVLYSVIALPDRQRSLLLPAQDPFLDQPTVLLQEQRRYDIQNIIIQAVNFLG